MADGPRGHVDNPLPQLPPLPDLEQPGQAQPVATAGASGGVRPATTPQGDTPSSKRQRRRSAAGKTPKSALHELYQQLGLQLTVDVQPVVTDAGAPAQPPAFTCQITCPKFCSNELGIFDGGTFSGRAGSKKGCEHVAASAALAALGQADICGGGGGDGAQPEAGGAETTAAGPAATPPRLPPPVEAAPAAAGEGNGASSGGDGLEPAQTSEDPGSEQLRADPELLLQSYTKAMEEVRALRAALEAERAARLEDRELFRKCVAILASKP